MTDEKRTVAAERDMPRIRHWLDAAVRHAVNDAAQALNAVRFWCDHTERQLQDAKRANDVDFDDVEDEVIRASVQLVHQVRALLPDLPAPSESGPGGGAHVDINSKPGDDRDF